MLTRERGRRYSWLAGWLEELRLGLLATSTRYIEHPGDPSSVPRPLLDPVKRDSRVRALRLIVNAHSERDREQAATASAARSARCAGRPQPPDVTPSGVACATSCPGPARSSLKAVMCRVASTESRQTGAVVYVVPRPSRVTARVYDIHKLHAQYGSPSPGFAHSALERVAGRAATCARGGAGCTRSKAAIRRCRGLTAGQGSIRSTAELGP